MRAFALLSGAFLLMLSIGCANPSGLVYDRDEWNDTIQIGSVTYVVLPTTKLFGPSGRPIELTQVPSVADPGVGVRYSHRARVEYRSVEDRGEHYLVWLWVRPGDPAAREG
ncbi:MAG: hypothetical protein AAF430_17435 [Myxococcota bacterium]